ncbi:MAG: 50S ribosomal protein L13 [Acidobacteriota bacterium]
MKTFLPKVSEMERKWFVVDASGHVLGRLASRIASVLMGKEKPCYTSFIDSGDFVIVVNADKVKLTGKKLDQKIYYSHSGYPGGLKQITARDLLDKHPERLIRSAVKGMLPKTRLGQQMGKKLKIYAGPEHRHQAQRPEPLVV